MMWLDFYKAGNRISNYSTSTVSFGLFTNKLQINARNWTSIIVLSPNNTFYTASSLNRQDKPNPALWLATQTARQNGVRSGPSAVSRKKRFPESHLLNYLLTKLTCYKMAGYWPCSFYVYGPGLRVCVKTWKKKNESHIQPFRPHTWSITRRNIMFDRFAHYIAHTFPWRVSCW